MGLGNGLLVDTAFELAEEFIQGNQASVFWKLSQFRGLRAAFVTLQIMACLPLGEQQAAFSNGVERIATGHADLVKPD